MAKETVTVIVSRDLDRLVWALEQQSNLVLRLRQIERRHPSRALELAIMDAIEVVAVLEESVRDGVVVESHAE